MTYNQAIADVLAMIDGEIEFTDKLRRGKRVRPEEETRMVEQVRKMIVLKARIGSMAKGPDTILPDEPLKLEISHHE